MKTPINYCASYQDLTGSNSLCHMKRNSCVLNPSDTDRIQQQKINQQLNQTSSSAYENGYKPSDSQQPPDTAGKKSDSTVEIERIIEKNTTDQVGKSFFFCPFSTFCFVLTVIVLAELSRFVRRLMIFSNSTVLLKRFE